MMRKVLAAASLSILLSLGSMGGVAAQEEEAAEAEAKSSGCMERMSGEMMRGGGHRGMMMHHGMGRRQGPTVVINVYPDGAVTTSGDHRMHKRRHMKKGIMDQPMPSQTMSEDEVRQMMADHMSNQDMNLDVGTVTIIDDDLASVEIVTGEGTPHHRMVVNRHTGRMMRAN